MFVIFIFLQKNWFESMLCTFHVVFGFHVWCLDLKLYLLLSWLVHVFWNSYCPNDFFALDTHSIILGFFFLGFGPPSFDVGSITKV
jgi:hypothetical protein